MDKQKQKKHGRSRSFTGGGLASFLSSTVASSSSSSPSRGNGRSSFNHRNAFSGPIVSIVPPEARGGAGSKRKQSGYRTPEPSLPKVSCIGKIKRSNSKTKKKVNPRGKNGGACPLPPRPTTTAEGRCRPMGSLVKRVFFQRSRSRSRSRDVRSSHGKGSNGVAAAPAPAGLGQMKRFTSGRAAFQDFDWREADIRSGRDQDDEEEEEEEDGFVAHWAPLVLGRGVVASEPRKEANLWRRRPMAPPTPLQLP